MWKEKLYTGTLSDTSGDTTNITKLPSSSTVTVNIARTDILNQKIKDFLNECGVSDIVYYPASEDDERKGNIYINGVPFQFYVVGTNTYFSAYIGSSVIVAGGSSQTCIFSGNDYSIRICLAGNPLGSFGFSIGATSYGSTSYNMPYLMMYKLKSAIDNSDWCFVSNQGTSLQIFVKADEDGAIFNSVGLTNLDDNGNNDIPASFMTALSNNKYPLIPRYLAWFRIVDGYVLVSNNVFNVTSISTPANSYFVKIGTKTYFIPHATMFGILIDCG